MAMTLKRGAPALQNDIRKIVGKMIKRAHPVDRAALQQVLTQYQDEGWSVNGIFLFDVLVDNVE